MAQANRTLGYFFSNEYTTNLTAQFGDRLEAFTFSDLCDLIGVIAQAAIFSRDDDSETLDMYTAWSSLEGSLVISDLVDQAINLLDGFPGHDAIGLQRAIVEAMDDAK